MKTKMHYEVTGDASLRFAHQSPRQVVARFFDKDGADRLTTIVREGVMPDGRLIESWEVDALCGGAVFLYLRPDGPTPESDKQRWQLLAGQE